MAISLQFYEGGARGDLHKDDWELSFVASDIGTVARILGVDFRKFSVAISRSRRVAGWCTFGSWYAVRVFRPGVYIVTRTGSAVVAGDGLDAAVISRNLTPYGRWLND